MINKNTEDLNNMKRHITIARGRLKGNRYKGNRLQARLNSARDELKLVEGSNKKGFNEDIANLSRTIDAMNNIAHVYYAIGNRQQARNFMDAKADNILKLGQECSKKYGDVVYGISRDETKRVNKNGFVVDVPGYGQVSWHITNRVANRLRQRGVKSYPYPIAKDSKLTNSELLISERGPTRRIRNQHQMVVRLNPNKTSEALKKYYSINRNHSSIQQQQLNKIVRRKRARRKLKVANARQRENIRRIDRYKENKSKKRNIYSSYANKGNLNQMPSIRKQLEVIAGKRTNANLNNYRRNMSMIISNLGQKERGNSGYDRCG